MLRMAAGIRIPAPSTLLRTSFAGMTISRWAGPNHQRLIKAGPLDIANKPGKVPLAHPVGTAGMCGELVDWNTRYSILDSGFSHY
jgi:hypothetical protein